jgi:hypothetical protein
MQLCRRRAAPAGHTGKSDEEQDRAMLAALGSGFLERPPAMNALPRSGASSRKAASWTIAYPTSAANRWIRTRRKRMVWLALAASAIPSGKAEQDPPALRFPRALAADNPEHLAPGYLP